jgi:hypothetical protein
LSLPTGTETHVPAEHPNAEVFEHVYDCFTSGDMDTLAELIAPDVV